MNMRAIEFLLEAAYDSMVLNMKTANPDQVANIDAQVKWAKQALVKSDRITWYLRIMQAWLSGEETKLKPLLGDYPFDDGWESLSGLGEYIQHFLGIQDAKIQNYAFVKQPASQVIADMYQLEGEWSKREAAKPKPVKTGTGDRVLFDFGGGLEWWYVDRAYCDEEGRSGAHCGNVVGQHKPDQRILSLRKNGHVLLTFILEPDGKLGEMKAKGNQKPAEKYHPQIIKLLMWDKVTGISGMGYLPDANFSVFDLNEKYLDYVEQHKPKLIADQLKITPFDLLKQPDHIRKRYADQVPELTDLIMDPSHENWDNLIESDPKKIIYAPHDLPNFKEKLKSVFRMSPHSGELMLKCPSSIARNRELIKELAGVNPYVLKGVNPTYVDDSTWLSAVIAMPSVLYDVPDSIKTPDFVLRAIEGNWVVLTEIPRPERTHDQCMVALSQHAAAFNAIPNEVRDEEIYQLAVEKKGGYIKSIPDDQMTKRMVLTALASYVGALGYVPERLQSDDLYLAAVEQSGINLSDVPVDFKTPTICATAVSNFSIALQFVPPTMRDETICRNALKLAVEQGVPPEMIIRLIPDDIKPHLGI